MSANPNLPKNPEALWALLADVLQGLEEAAEDPKLEGGHDWREHGAKDRTPGIRRTCIGRPWRRMVEWTNASGSWRWTYTGQGSWQWPDAEEMGALAARADRLIEKADQSEGAGEDGAWVADAYSLLGDLSALGGGGDASPAERAERARAAFEFYVRTNPGAQVSDLMTNLMHLADVSGEDDGPGVLATAELNYAAEAQDPEEAEDLGDLIEQAATLVRDFGAEVADVTNDRTRDEIRSTFEGDAWSLVEELAKQALKSD
ncbi:hypothetical protein ACGF8D_10570 [Streptomyces massasporeus]|uniref:hypothetical protein n=1 Tax=Streptomyces massasporeus TaxID=67324 RepID=UPI00371E7AC7